MAKRRRAGEPRPTCPPTRWRPAAAAAPRVASLRWTRIAGGRPRVRRAAFGNTSLPTWRAFTRFAVVDVTHDNYMRHRDGTW